MLRFGGGGCRSPSLVGGSSRYLCAFGLEAVTTLGAGVELGDDALDNKEGFLLGMGGGAVFRSTCVLFVGEFCNVPVTVF